MPVLNITVGAVNITNYLIAVVAKSASPEVEETREVYAPEELEASFNASITVGDASIYKVSWWESSDGETLDQLLGASTWDAKLRIPISETRFYLTSGGREIDPASDQNVIVDSYLDGKTITKVQKDIALLVPPDYEFKQYDLVSGGGIELLGDLKFNENEIIAIEITYVQSYESSASNAGMYDSVIKLTTNTTLNGTHRNKCLKCEASGSTMVITLEDINTVPEGKFYFFRSNGGNQKKVRIVPASGQIIRFQGEDRDEISIGLGEHVRLEKYTDDDADPYWEVVDAHAGIASVGERVAFGRGDVKNTIPEDGSLQDGDEEPRLWQYVLDLPATLKITSASVVLGNFAHTVGYEGLFYMHPTLKKFRMPNSQGRYIRGLKSYDADDFGTDTDRTYDYPGGSGEGRVGPHTHPLGTNKQDSAGGNQQNTHYNGIDNGGVAWSTAPVTATNTGTGSGATTEVNNIGDVFLRRS